ncbi:hypothetical protein [Clostridium ljungdahlii]|uniref:hypothetical protein n=1 Tax=Clostridium ljungdahlii TaxID=1538 RepID=UPI0009EE6DE9|nr:hypothetical protein [Clostridium ljungdahlii]
MNRFLFRILFLPLSLDELSRGVATVSSHFDRSGSVTVGSHRAKNKIKPDIMLSKLPCIIKISINP